MYRAYASFLLILLCYFGSAQAQDNIPDSINLKYENTVNISSTNFNQLLPVITKPGNSTVEKLTLVYYWVYEHITFDKERFTQSSTAIPLTISQTLASGKGMCYEYNDLISAACDYLKIPGYNIEGYVKEYDFKAGQAITQNNHIWHAVYIDNEWKLIDLLWACGSVTVKDNDFVFNKKMNLQYFLALPESFLTTHLPADPIWQFNDRPLTPAGFTAKKYRIDTNLRATYINDADSIRVINSLSIHDREITSAVRAYNFNPDNSAQLITTYYNVAIDIIDDKKSTKAQLLKAKKYLTQTKLLIPSSNNEGIRQLLPTCDRAIKSINDRLSLHKT